MCGRFTLSANSDAIQSVFPWLTIPAESLSPRYNIAPSQAIAVVPNDGKQTLDFFKWGLIPSWAKDPKIGNRMINARSETLHEKPSFKSGLKYHRCLILADGFYEWSKKANEPKKTPFYFYKKDRQPFAFAGLWETWLSPDGSEIKSATIITSEPNEIVKPFHNRMPVIVKPELYSLWLSQDQKNQKELKSIFETFPNDLLAVHEVSTLVNNPSIDKPDCIVNI